MDPLSITVATLALVEAAIGTAKSFEALKAVQKLPRDFALLLEEVSDLQYQLGQCKKQLSQNRNVAERLHGTQFLELASAAKAKLDLLADDLPANAFRAGFGPGHLHKLQLYWSGLVDGKSRLRRFRDEVRDIRLGLIQASTFLVQPLLCDIDAKVDGLSEAQKALDATQREVLKAVVAISGKAREANYQDPPSYQASCTETATVSIDLLNTSPKSKMTRRKPVAPASASTSTKVLADLKYPEDKFAIYCMPWCSCRCHKPRYMNSYDALKDVFGCLSISHSGVPGLTSTCNETRCRRKISPKVTMRYRLPRAIANFQFMTCSFSTLAGVELRVKLPRVVDWTAPIWLYATSGNYDAIAKLFRSGRASPWDVSPLGGNLLHYATDHWNPELCRLLLEADLDPEAEDDFKGTGVSIAWERVLSGKMTANDACTVASIFKNTDYLSSRCFTVIHKIVLGLFTGDLDYELSRSTEHINTQDSHGRTPLSWASTRGDERAVRTLLKYGARTDIPDMQGCHALHYVKSTTCAEQLLEFGADLNALNGEKQTPLYTTCRYVASASLAEFLIQAGSDVNAVDQNGQTALHPSHGACPPFVNVLLKHGADLNSRNSSGDTPLRFPILFNWHAMLRQILRDRPEADFGSINGYNQSFAHAIARAADVETVRILAEAQPSSLKPDLSLRDHMGKTAEQYFEERLGFLEDGEKEELQDAFADLLAAVKGDIRLATSDLSLFDEKLHVTLRVTEIADDLDMAADVFHDAVEGF